MCTCIHTERKAVERGLGCPAGGPECFMSSSGGLKSKVYLFIRVTTSGVYANRRNWMNGADSMFA